MAFKFTKIVSLCHLHCLLGTVWPFGFTTSSFIFRVLTAAFSSLSCNSFLTFSTAGLSPWNISWQDTSSPYWGTTSEYFLIPVTAWVIDLPVDKNKWQNVQGTWPTIESSFFTTTTYKSCEFPSYFSHCSTSPMTGIHISVYIYMWWLLIMVSV